MSHSIYWQFLLLEITLIKFVTQLLYVLVRVGERIRWFRVDGR